MNDWKLKKNAEFYFYGKKFNVILTDEEEGSFLICKRGREVCIARQFESIWIVAYGTRKEKGVKADNDEDDEYKFKSVADAWIKISTQIFEPLEEAGV